jgi:hypothetical protein
MWCAEQSSVGSRVNQALALDCPSRRATVTNAGTGLLAEKINQERGPSASGLLRLLFCGAPHSHTHETTSSIFTL